MWHRYRLANPDCDLTDEELWAREDEEMELREQQREREKAAKNCPF